jgi:putative ABC transport system permease protein
MPIRFLPADLSRSAQSVFAFGRLTPGTSVEQARQEFTTLNAGLAQAFPEANEGLGTLIAPLQTWLTDDVRTPVGLVFGLALVLLVAAAVNVAGLQVGAISARRAEISLRVALGAGRGRVVRQIVTEHVIVVVVGGALGVILAIVMVPILSASMPSLTFGLDRIAIDGRVLACAALVTIMAGLGSAIVPAMHWVRQMPGDALKSVGRASSERRLTRARSLLVAGQVGMAAVLLTSSAMLVKSYLAMTGVDPGFDGRQVYSLEYRLPANKYQAPAEQIRVHDAIVARVALVPGVRRAAAVRSLPFSGNGESARYVLGEAPGMEPQTADMNSESRDNFDIMGVSLLEGRGFTSEDTTGSEPVILVSRAFAERAWPAGGAIGRAIVFPDFEVRARVVGVVADVRHRSLLEALQPTFYASASQSPGHFMTLVAEIEGDPMARRDAIRQAIWEVDPDQPVWKERTLESLVDGSLTSPRFTFRSLMVFAGVSVLLVVAGLYGVVSQAAARRRREIGVRLALGATRRDIYRGVIGSGLIVTGAGLVVGLAGAVLVTRLIEGLLFGTSSSDAVPYAVTAGVLFAVSAAACYVPARRAASVDPARVLRENT